MVNLIYRIVFCILILSSSAAIAASNDDVVKVGVLHSLTGTMAISEVAVKNATLLAIDEINASGGLLGKKIVPVLEDGESNPAVFAQKAQKLIQNDHVVTVFGGWTSASRKAMLPLFERFHSLLWYPVQFEGNECSPNIMYSGAEPNQQILPALNWAKSKGYKRYFLIGSDYVFPRTANLILKKHIEADQLSLVGEEYVPLGSYEFSAIIEKIKNAKPDVIFNTLNGDSNVSFFKQLVAAGLPPTKMPVMSFSIAELEAKAIGPALIAGSFATWNYFQVLDNPENKKFVAAYQAKYGSNSVVDDPVAHGYLDVYFWAAAVKKANSFNVDLVRKAATDLDFQKMNLGLVKFAKTQSMYQNAYVGELQDNSQFKIVWQSSAPIPPEPYDPLAFPGMTCVLH